MHESSFIPAYDDYYQEDAGPGIREGHRHQGRLPVDQRRQPADPHRHRRRDRQRPRHDIDIYFNWPFLFDDKLVDVSDIAEEIGKKNGGWYDSIKEAVHRQRQVEGDPVRQRRPAHELAHRTGSPKSASRTFPTPGTRLLEAGIKLKKAGHPFGFELGHGFGDNHGWLYPLLWSYGAREVEPDGKTDRDRFDETARAVDFCRKFFQDDDVRGLCLAGPMSATTRPG